MASEISMEALYFWGAVRMARQMKAAGGFGGPEAEAILDDLSALAVHTAWPALKQRVEEAGARLTEWLEVA